MRHAWVLLLLMSSCGWEPPQDWAVGRYLASTGHIWSVDGDGDFVVTILLSPGRSQKVWIRSKPNQFLGQDFREVFSLAQEYSQTIPPKLLETLMEDSWKNRLTGSWVLVPKGEGSSRIIAFMAKIRTKADTEVLGATLLEVAKAADDLEKIRSPKDRF